MSAVTTTYDGTPTRTPARWRTLRPMLVGAAAFDGAMGVACLAAGSQIGDWLSISTGIVRVTGGVFLLAALAGVETVLRPSIGLRWIIGANSAFALWCVAAIGIDSPGAWGEALLAVSAVASGATAVAEHRLARG